MEGLFKFQQSDSANLHTNYYKLAKTNSSLNLIILFVLKIFFGDYLAMGFDFYTK
jgi:hypothetical protein